MRNATRFGLILGLCGAVSACAGDTTTADTGGDGDGTADTGAATGASTAMASSGVDGGSGGSGDAGDTAGTAADSNGTAADSGDTGATDDSGGPACGNGIVDAGEDCDGRDLAGQNCESMGADEGTLACTDECTFDDRGCVIYSCGNDMVEGREVCDGTDLDGQDCSTQGATAGTLACNDRCMGFDVSGCTTCGDAMAEGDEDCDGADLEGETCLSLDFDSGQLACADDCTFDTTGCANCGDGVIGGDELCDGSELDGEDCASQGLGGGTLACLDDCSGYDTSGCSAVCQGQGDSCAAGQSCCAGLQCCSGVPVPPGAEYCSNLCPISDVNRKENFAPVDHDAVLESVAALPVTTWNYKAEDPAVRHIGPMAQDFRASFEVGSSDEAIFQIDADGVALSSIKALHHRLEESERANAALQRRLADLEERLSQVESAPSCEPPPGR